MCKRNLPFKHAGCPGLKIAFRRCSTPKSPCSWNSSNSSSSSAVELACFVCSCFVDAIKICCGVYPISGLAGVFLGSASNTVLLFLAPCLHGCRNRVARLCTHLCPPSELPGCKKLMQLWQSSKQEEIDLISGSYIRVEEIFELQSRSSQHTGRIAWPSLQSTAAHWRRVFGTVLD